jgi:hypothetical protein
MGRIMHKELEPLGGTYVPSLSEFWTWVKEAFTPAYQSEIEQYLQDATDQADVEHRMKTLKYRGML